MGRSYMVMGASGEGEVEDKAVDITSFLRWQKEMGYRVHRRIDCLLIGRRREGKEVELAV